VVKKPFSISDINQGFVYFIFAARAQVTVDHLKLGAIPSIELLPEVLKLDF
jgi:hypothetical protein